MPNRFIPLPQNANLEELLPVLNGNFAQLDSESVVKVFKQSNGRNAIITGRLPYDGGYGVLIYDTDGIPRVLQGIAPDGSIGLFVSKEGISVLDAFS